jgi:hypothetical protein
LLFGTQVINVITAIYNHAEGEGIKMTFSIDTENNITVMASKAEALAKTDVGIAQFTNEKELAQLASSWSIPGSWIFGTDLLV